MGKRGPKPKPPEDRFWRRVTPTGFCWLWDGFIMPNGYGQFPLVTPKRHVYAHRWAYEALVAPIPEGMVIDHLCRVRACVNPDHLVPCTQAENIARSFHPSHRCAWTGMCQSGKHEMRPENTYEWTSKKTGHGMRRCRACRRERERRARSG